MDTAKAQRTDALLGLFLWPGAHMSYMSTGCPRTLVLGVGSAFVFFRGCLDHPSSYLVPDGYIRVPSPDGVESPSGIGTPHLWLPQASKGREHRVGGSPLLRLQLSSAAQAPQLWAGGAWNTLLPTGAPRESF